MSNLYWKLLFLSFIYLQTIQMSIPWQQSRVHSLNNSHTKSTYAFPKSPRFKSTTKPMCDSFYNISKNLHTQNGASIGKGEKTTFGDKYGFPSPLQYNIKSSFDGGNKGVKLSLGRENIKYGGIFRKSETPDPGHYNPKESRIKSPNYSIRPKLKEKEYSYMKNPGPGSYNSLSTITATGIYKVSNIQNCICPKIKPSKVYDPMHNEKTPGPGQYDRKQNMNQTGKFFISKYPDSRCRTFSKSTQPTLVRKGEQKLPGPGYYNYYSEFGAPNKVL